jgi:DNA modification methylase
MPPPIRWRALEATNSEEEHMKLKPIHPFPARMGSEIAFNAIKDLPPNSKILDPMSGSGTVLRVATEAGHKAVGFDLDPLSVLMARVWTTPLAANSLSTAALLSPCSSRQLEPHMK